MVAIAYHAREIDMANQQKDDSMSRSDTSSPGGAQPVQGQSGKTGGTDAAAGARMAGESGNPY